MNRVDNGYRRLETSGHESRKTPRKTPRKILRKIRCRLGMHGPNWITDAYAESESSVRIGSFKRQCPSCKQVWAGREIVVKNVRTVGDWVKH